MKFNHDHSNNLNQVLAPHSKQHLIFVPSVIAGQQEQILQVDIDIGIDQFINFSSINQHWNQLLQNTTTINCHPYLSAARHALWPRDWPCQRKQR